MGTEEKGDGGKQCCEVFEARSSRSKVSHAQQMRLPCEAMTIHRIPSCQAPFFRSRSARSASSRVLLVLPAFVSFCCH